MYAVIASGGKQHRVEQGATIEVDRLDAEDGSEIELSPVLLVDGDAVLATPDQLQAARVVGTVVGTALGRKINGFTYKRRTNQRRRYGHRQQHTVVEITSITAE